DPGLADALADWTDADDVPRPRGAERDWYLAQTPPLVPRNAPFASVGELALVRGIDAAALARLRPFVTVAGEHAVNPNTASREVLLAVVQDPAAVDRLLAARARRPLAVEHISALLAGAPDTVRLALPPRGQHYAVRGVMRFGRCTSDLGMPVSDGASETSMGRLLLDARLQPPSHRFRQTRPCRSALAPPAPHAAHASRQCAES